MNGTTQNDPNDLVMCQSASKIDHVFSTAVMFYSVNTSEYIFSLNIQRCFDDQFWMLIDIQDKEYQRRQDQESAKQRESIERRSKPSKELER
jgi:hypothetical protein